MMHATRNHHCLVKDEGNKQTSQMYSIISFGGSLNAQKWWFVAGPIALRPIDLGDYVSRIQVRCLEIAILNRQTRILATLSAMVFIAAGEELIRPVDRSLMHKSMQRCPSLWVVHDTALLPEDQWIVLLAVFGNRQRNDSIFVIF